MSTQRYLVTATRGQYVCYRAYHDAESAAAAIEFARVYCAIPQNVRGARWRAEVQS